MLLQNIFISLCLRFAFATASQSCPDGDKILMQTLGKLPSSNGCSKPAGISVGGEEDFTYCCDRHDACYSTCGMPKDFCEQDFRRCMSDLCKTVFGSNPQCEGAASIYTMGTSMFGGGGFQDMQDDHCVCVKKEEAKEHYAKLYQKIYKNHSSKSEEEISDTIGNLMGKIPDNTNQQVPKLAKLFYKLVKKYDSSIRHEGTRIGMKPPSPKDEL